MLKYKCCHYCYEKIYAEDTETAHIWPQICGYACMHNGYVHLRIDHTIEKNIKILEDMGFAVSHETDKQIKVRMNGLMLDADREYAFCIDKPRHCHAV